MFDQALWAYHLQAKLYLDQRVVTNIPSASFKALKDFEAKFWSVSMFNLNWFSVIQHFNYIFSLADPNATFYVPYVSYFKVFHQHCWIKLLAKYTLIHHHNKPSMLEIFILGAVADFGF